MPLLPRLLRRLLFPVMVLFELLVLVVALVALVLGLLTWWADRRLRVARLAAMVAGYVIVQLGGVAAFAGVWLARPVLRDAEQRELRLLVRLLDTLLALARFCLAYRVEACEPGGPDPLDGRRPVLVLARHGGLGDSFVVAWLLTARYGRRPRVVLKDVLLWEPLFDVILTRMGALFIPPPRRRSRDLADRVGELAGELEDGDGLLLFPEGANWTNRRRLVAIRRLWEARRPAAARAAALMQHVLPPRSAGALACLEQRPQLPVVIVAHAGMDDLTRPGRLWAALPFRDPLKLGWWPAAPVPTGREDREAWLTAEWAVVEEWVDRAASATGP